MTRAKKNETIDDGRDRPAISDERLAAIEAICDEDIDLSDIPELDEAWFSSAKVVRPTGDGADADAPSPKDEQ